MMATKTFDVKAPHCDDSYVTLAVDFDVLTPALANEINSFWSDADYRLLLVDGDPVMAVVRLFGTRAISYLLSIGGADITAFNEKDREWWTTSVLEAEHEGWPPYAALGIKITEAVVAGMSYDDVEVEAGDDE